MRKFAVQKIFLYHKMQFQNSINRRMAEIGEMVADIINPA